MANVYRNLIILVLLIHLSTTVLAQNYGCLFLETIVKTVHVKGYEYNVYSNAIDKIKRINPRIDKVSMLKLEDKLRDSLRTCCQHSSFFNDSLFHLKGKILLIDTFNFFSNSCIDNKHLGVLIVNDEINLSCSSEVYTIIELKSIRVYQNGFIIRLRHSKSKNEVDFHFELIANHQPKLDKVSQGYIE